MNQVKQTVHTSVSNARRGGNMKEGYDIVSFNHKGEKEGDVTCTMIRIRVGDVAVGAIQQIRIIRSSIDKNPEIWVGRARFDRDKISELFSRGFVNVQAQRLPMQIEIETKDLKDETVTTTVVSNCWIKKVGYSYTVKDFIIIDQMDLVAEEMIYGDE